MLIVFLKDETVAHINLISKNTEGESTSFEVISWKFFLQFNLLQRQHLIPRCLYSSLAYSLDVINGVCRNTIFISKIERTCDAIIIFFLQRFKFPFNLKAPLYHSQLIYFREKAIEGGARA